MQPHKVEITPRWTARGYKYDVTYEGRVIVSGSKAPLGDACRALAGEGKDGKVEVWRAGSQFPAMRGEISDHAKRTVWESATAGPVFSKYRPYPTTSVEYGDER